jgi:hypothetical protein
VEIFVDPRGTLLSLKADRGVIGVRSGARVYMPMRSCWIVTAGPLRIQVEPQEAHGANRRYGITVVAPRAAAGTDRERVAACAELRAAEQSLDTGSAAESCLRRCSSFGARYLIGKRRGTRVRKPKCCFKSGSPPSAWDKRRMRLPVTRDRRTFTTDCRIGRTWLSRCSTLGGALRGDG